MILFNTTRLNNGPNNIIIDHWRSLWNWRVTHRAICFRQEHQKAGGRRRKRNKVPKSMLDKLMMAATFRKRSVKKGKKYHRKGGNLLNNFGLMGG